MAQSFTLQSLTPLFSFPFKDPRWKQKCLVGVALTFGGLLTFGILNLLVLGYVYQIQQRIILENGEPYLPEWEDWSRLFMDGMRLAGGIFILLVPALILFVVAYLFEIIPTLSILVSTQDSSNMSPFFPLWSLISLIPFGLTMIFSLLAGVLTPVVAGHVVATHAWTAVFRVKEWWKILRANLSGFLICYLIVIGISFISVIPAEILYFTIILCCLAPILMSCATFYIYLISYPLYAIAYRSSVQSLSTPAQNLTDTRQ